MRQPVGAGGGGVPEVWEPGGGAGGREAGTGGGCGPFGRDGVVGPGETGAGGG